MRGIGVRVALLIALVSPVALWVIAGRERGALAGGGPVLAASLAGFLSIGIASMVMSLRQLPESARGDIGLFGACLSFFGGCLVSAVIEAGGALPPVWVHLIPPIAIGVLWATIVKPGSSTARPLDDMLSALTRATDKEPVAARIVEHLSDVGTREDLAVQATAVLIVARPLAVEGFEDKVAGLMDELDIDGCPLPLKVLLAYERVLVRLRLGDVGGAREVLSPVFSGVTEAEKRLASAARARVLVAEGKPGEAVSTLESHVRVGDSDDLDALDAHSDSALHAAFAVAHMVLEDVDEAERSLERLAQCGGADELRYLATSNTAVAERAAERLARQGG